MDQCHACGKEFKSVNHHYALSECSYPNLPNRLKNRVVGELAGDGGLEKVWKTKRLPYLRVRMAGKSGKAYLEDLDRAFCQFSLGKPTETNNRRYKNRDKILYSWQTKTHPFFDEIAKRWYKKRGGKKFPKGLKPSPVFLKAWYSGDGSLCYTNSRSRTPRAKIAACGQYSVSSRVRNIFKQSVFNPSFTKGVYNTGVNEGEKWLRIRFSTKETAKFLRYMGNPPPGYGYKWDHPDLSPEEKAEKPFC